jgi:hypothetical protein
MTKGATAHLCDDASDVFVPFLEGVRMLGIPRITAERWLRARNPRLPMLVRVGRHRFFKRGDIEARIAQPTADQQTASAGEQAVARPAAAPPSLLDVVEFA